jgi:hypothetical protein
MPEGADRIRFSAKPVRFMAAFTALVLFEVSRLL